VTLVTTLTFALLLVLGCPNPSGSDGDGNGSQTDDSGTDSRPEIKERAADIAADTSGSYPGEFTGFGDLVYFAAETSAEGTELWHYDGSSAELVEDIYSGSDDSYPEDFIVYGAELYFSAENSASGMELWTLTENGPAVAEDINTGGGDGYWGHPAVYDGELYFQGDDGNTRKNLFRYNGTAAEFVGDITPGSSSFPSDLTAHDGRLYFAAEQNGGATNADGELYYYDVATDEIKLPSLEEVNPSGTGSLPARLIVYDGKLHFEADSGDGEGRELYVYEPADPDGDAEVYERITSIRSGSDAQIGNVTVFDGMLYFTAYDGVDRAIYRYDGSTVTELTDIVDGHTPYYPSSLEVYDDHLYFSADDGTHGSELWRYGGSSPEAELVWDIQSGSDGGSPSDLAAIGTKLYFAADDGSSGTELFVYQSPK
jgi:ELWxxDGT repeat protein